MTALTNSDTISTSGLDVARVTSTEDVSDIRLQAGTQLGKLLFVINEGEFTLSFAALNVSLVEDMVPTLPFVILPMSAVQFVWNGAFWERPKASVVDLGKVELLRTWYNKKRQRHGAG